MQLGDDTVEIHFYEILSRPSLLYAQLIWYKLEA